MAPLPEPVQLAEAPVPMIRAECAGILFRAGNRVLLLRRSDTGEWAFPGGHVEPGETLEQAAVRECQEELGICPEGERRLFRVTSGAVIYTTYLQDAPEFPPVLNDEHAAYVWAPPGGYPAPLHPQVAETLALLNGNELDIARAMAAGEMPSPQRFENVWLFDIRITGTGVAYRSKHDEYVFRDPAIFCTADFLARCSGLPVVFGHPEKNQTLTSEDYQQRNIGSVMLPYRKGDEVWGVAKIFDDDGALLMQTTHTTTSPGVLTPPNAQTQTLADGTPLLIESTPQYLDHIAVVTAGVWDKGGDPSGIRNDSMSDEKEGEKKYGEVKFADPANDKYPIDTEEHIRAAWDYIHKAEDADKYSPDDLEAIKRRIVAAWKDKIDSSGPPEANARKDAQMADGTSDDDLRTDIKALLSRFDSVCAENEVLKKRLDSLEAREMPAPDMALDAKKDAAEDEDDKAEDAEAKKDADDDKAEDKEAESKKDADEEDEKEAKKDSDEDDGKAEAKAEDKKDARKDAKKDAAEPEKARKDSTVTRADSADTAALKAEIARLNDRLASIGRERTDTETDQIAAAYARADAIYQMFGERASHALPGEMPMAYRRRLASKLQRHSEKFGKVRLDSVDSASTFDLIEREIYADAEKAARSPAHLPPMKLVKIVRQDNDTGRQITEFQGDPLAWMQAFMPPMKGAVIKFDKHAGTRN